MACEAALPSASLSDTLTAVSNALSRPAPDDTAPPGTVSVPLIKETAPPISVSVNPRLLVVDIVPVLIMLILPVAPPASTISVVEALTVPDELNCAVPVTALKSTVPPDAAFSVPVLLNTISTPPRITAPSTGAETVPLLVMLNDGLLRARNMLTVPALVKTEAASPRLLAVNVPMALVLVKDALTVSLPDISSVPMAAVLVRSSPSDILPAVREPEISALLVNSIFDAPARPTPVTSPFSVITASLTATLLLPPVPKSRLPAISEPSPRVNVTSSSNAVPLASVMVESNSTLPRS